MNKLIKEALKDIKEWHDNFPQNDEDTLKFWLKHLYNQGMIDGLQWSIDNRKKND